MRNRKDNKKKVKPFLLKKSNFERLSEKKFIHMSDDTDLLILTSKNTERDEDTLTMVFVPGWGTPISGWDDLLMEARKYFDLIYIETREMKSSIISKNSEYDINRFSTDLAEIIYSLKLDTKKIVLFSSSFGSIIAAHALANRKIDPLLTILVGPPSKIEMPPLFRYLVHIAPSSSFYVFAPIGRWWVKRFKSDTPEQTARYLNIIDTADPIKWKRIGKKISFESYWSIYEQIKSRVLVIDESEDKLHQSENTKKIAKSIENSNYIDLKSNDFIHSAGIVGIIREEIIKYKDRF